MDGSFWGWRSRRGWLQRSAFSSRSVLGLVSVVRVLVTGFLGMRRTYGLADGRSMLPVLAPKTSTRL